MSEPNSRRPSGTMAIPWVARRSGLTRVMFLPSYRIEPSVGWCRPVIVRSRVDLPAPLAPMIAYTSPGYTRSETRSSARSWPWCTTRSLTSRIGVPLPGRGSLTLLFSVTGLASVTGCPR